MAAAPLDEKFIDEEAGIRGGTRETFAAVPRPLPPGGIGGGCVVQFSTALGTSRYYYSSTLEYVEGSEIRRLITNENERSATQPAAIFLLEKRLGTLSRDAATNSEHHPAA